MLRKAYRVMGVDRKQPGLGGLSLGVIMSSTALYLVPSPALAEDAVCVDPVTGARVPAQAAQVGAATGNQVVCGSGATAVGLGAVAIGENASAAGDEALAFGTEAEADGIHSVAIGSQAEALNTNAIAIGRESDALGIYSIAIGSGASATGDLGTAVGNNTTARQGDTSLGAGALRGSADSALTVAVGFNTGASAGDVSRGTLVGTFAGVMADGVQNSFVGYYSGAAAAGTNNVGMGTAAGAVVIGNNNVSLGNHAGTQAELDSNGSPVAIKPSEFSGAVNIGYNTRGLANNAVAIGTETIAAQRAIGIGTDTSANGLDAVAIGSNSAVTADRATAIGKDAEATEEDALAIGTGARATAVDAIAIGHGALAEGSVAMGPGALAGGGGAAFGDNADAGGTSLSEAIGIALGTALGNTAVVSVNGGVALGAGSRAKTAAGVTGYVPASANAAQAAAIAATTGTLGAVSVGDAANGQFRQITGVAAGTEDSDAVNVAQLKAVAAVAQTASAGWNVTDANGNAANIGPDGNMSFVGDGNVRVTQTGDDDDGVIEVTLNPDLDLTAAGSLTAGNAVLNSNGLVLNGGPSILVSGINAGGLAITNVAPGVNLTDAVNVSQLNAVAQAANAGWNVSAQGANGTNVGASSPTGNDIDLRNSDGNIIVSKSAGSNNVTFDLAGNIAVDSMTAGNTTVNTNGVSIASGPNGVVSLGGAGLDNGGNRVTNVAAGIDATDAVNVSQLNAAVGNVSVGFAGNSGGTVTRSSGQTLSIQGEATAAGSYSGGNIRTTTDPASGTVHIEMADAPRFGDVTINDGGTGKITGVAAATLSSTSTDAVNGSQIVALGDSIAATLSPGSSYDPATNNINARIVVGGDVYNNVQDALQAVNANAGSGWNMTTAATGSGVATGTSIAPVAPGTTASLVAGDNIVVHQNGSEVQIAVNPNLTGIQSVAIVDGPVIDNNGIDMGGSRISNMGAGVAPTDAVNVAQLDAGLATTLGQANHYTNMAIADLRFNLGRYNRDADGGTAAAMAMSQVPQAFEPGMGIMGVGMSTWQGEQAIAFGFSKASDNGRVVVKGTGSYNTRRQGGAAVGVGFQF